MYFFAQLGSLSDYAQFCSVARVRAQLVLTSVVYLPSRGRIGMLGRKIQRARILIN